MARIYFLIPKIAIQAMQQCIFTAAELHASASTPHSFSHDKPFLNPDCISAFPLIQSESPSQWIFRGKAAPPNRKSNGSRERHCSCAEPSLELPHLLMGSKRNLTTPSSGEQAEMH
jgi:hypothetical protein